MKSTEATTTRAKQPSNASAKQFLCKDDVPEMPLGTRDPTLKDMLVVDLSGMSWRAVRRALRAAREIERTKRRMAAMSSQASPGVVSEDATLECVRTDPKHQVDGSSDRGENRSLGPEERMVFVQMPHDRTFPFGIYPGEPISTLKHSIAQRVGLEPHYLRLIHRFKDLRDADSCDILRNGTNVKVLLRLHGGVNTQEPTQSPNKTTPYTDVNALFDLLRKRDIALLRGSWLLKRAGFVLAENARSIYVDENELRSVQCHGWQLSDQKPRPLPRRQELEAAEPEAYLPPEEVESMYEAADDELKQFAVPVCGLSYCWEGAGAPDPEGRVLQALCQLLANNTGRKCSKNNLDFLPPAFLCDGYPDIGIFVDFSSVHQKDRTDVEELSFKAALRGMNLLYGHRLTYCALLYNQDKHLALPRDARGWPVFEELMSRLAKDTSFSTIPGRSKLMSTAENRKQKPPLPPSVFDALVKTLTFTSKADSGMVAKLYRDAVMDALGKRRSMTYSRLPWRDAELATLGRAMIEAGVSSLEDVNLVKLQAEMSEGAAPFWRALAASRASLSRLYLVDCEQMKRLPASIGDLTSIKELNLCGCVAIEELPATIGELTSLETLRMPWCRSLKELPASIGQLKRLKKLDMSMCRKLEELPVGGLNSLEALDVSHCSSLMKLLPGTAEVLPSLKRICFHDSKLSPEDEPLKTILKRPGLDHDCPRQCCCVVS